MTFRSFVFFCLIGILSLPSAIAQSSSITSGPDEIIRKLEAGGVFDVPDFEFTTSYDAYKEHDQLQGLFINGLTYHGDSTKVFCWYGLPESIPEGGKVPAVLLVHGGGGTVFPDWVKKWTDRGYAAISIALEGQVPGEKDLNAPTPFWPTHDYSGPFRRGFFSDLETENPEDVWFFHAVADVILAHSLIRSFPEIDTTEIGITGISWGGILTSVIAGIDDRLDFVIPVYGCGYLQDSPLYKKQMSALSATAQQEYLRSWDPSNYIPSISAPTLYVNGTNDCHFTMNCFTKSYQALKVEKYLRIEHNMLHGHGPGWSPESIYQFADYVTGGTPQPVVFTFGSLANQERVKYIYQGELESASILYTSDTVDWDCDNYNWMEIPAELDTSDQTVTARIPKEAQYYFANGISSRGTLFSSSMRKAEPDPKFAAYPEFSWDHVPLYMHMRKSEAFNQEELEYLAGFPILTLEKTTGANTYGSSEKGAVEAARGIKAINPDTKVLYYWNAMLNYSTYEAKAIVDTIEDAFLVDSGTGDLVLHAGIREVYDLSNQNVVEWWVDQCVEMTGKPEIDGVFVDASLKAINPSVYRSEIGDEKKESVLEGYTSMMTEMNLRMDSSKLKLANLIRATQPNSCLEYMHFFDGSYLEGFDGDPAYLAKGMNAVQTAARNGKIIALCAGGGDIPQTPSTDENGHLITDIELQKRLDFFLAIFLVCAEEYSYFLMHDGYNVNPGASKLWLTRFAEYDKSLGPPQGPALQSGYVYTRKFKNAAVWLDINQRKGIINWDSDSIPYPVKDPEPVRYSLKFIVKKANAPSYVSGALISLDTLSALTNSAGFQLFSLDSGLYHYNIALNGFFPVDSTIHLISDSTVYIPMQSTSANVKFRIKELETPVVYADILINDHSMQTNNVGLAVFVDLAVFENYSWIVSKEGYESDSGSFYLIADTTINVLMDSLTADSPDVVFLTNEIQLRIYPVPANSYIFLESEQEIQEIYLLDLSGRVLVSESVRARNARINLEGSIPSICLLKVIFNNNSFVTKIVKQ